MKDCSMKRPSPESETTGMLGLLPSLLCSHHLFTGTLLFPPTLKEPICLATTGYSQIST